MDIHVYKNQNVIGKHVIQTNPSKFDEKVIVIFVQITFETRKRNTGFYVLRQGAPEGCSSEGYASFKQVKSWPWHVRLFLDLVYGEW